MRGHSIHALTLPGLEQDQQAARRCPNLDDHVQHVLATIEEISEPPIVLCGHSYGGMVITGVADRAPRRIAALAYLDAYVPENGASVWSLATNSMRRYFIDGASRDGRLVSPPDRTNPRLRPHPLATLLQTISLAGAWRSVPDKSFVLATAWRGSPFRQLAARVVADPDWRTYTLDCGHDLAREAAAETAAILLEIAGRLI